MITRTASFIRAHRWGAFVVATYLALGVVFSVVNPIHEATDELRHYRYVRYIADYGRLPVQSAGEGNAQAHHPPLYYATAALASFWVHPADPLGDPLSNPQWGFRNWEVGTDNKNLYLHGPDEAWPYRDEALAAHLARWVTLLWGAGAVALTYALGRVLLPEQEPVAVTAAMLVALNPMFLYLGAAVNNDVPAALIGAAITYVALIAVRDGLTMRRIIALGVLYGLASLVKFNLVAMLGVIEGGLFLGLLAPLGGGGPQNGHPSRWRAFLRANVIILGLTLLISGWWYVRNTILYGEPTGFLRLTEIWGVRDPRAGVRLAGRELRYAWTSLWGRFGYGQIPLPDSLYIAVAVLCGLGLLGLIAYLVRERRALSPARWGMFGLLMMAVLVNFAVLYAYITISPAGAMGRFFFPGLPAFATLIAVGLIALWPEKLQPFVAGAVGLAMLAFVLVALIGYLAPAYALPEQITPPDDPLNIPVGDVARILAYEVTPQTIRRGDEISVTVTWEVLQPTPAPYMVFIHVFDQQGVMIAQRDTYTGLGNYPSNWWRPGHIFTETYRLIIPETTYEPNRLDVRLGLYHPDLGRLPIEAPDVQDSALLLAQVLVEEEPDSEYPNQMFVNWDNRFALVGYYVDPRVVRPGERVFVTLYWQALDPPPDEDYKVFLHVVQDWNKWAGLDGAPVSPDTRTREWVPGEVYRDERRIPLPEDIPPGLYQLELGWFSDATGERLNIIAEDGHIVDNWMPLNTIRVIPPGENE